MGADELKNQQKSDLILEDLLLSNSFHVAMQDSLVLSQVFGFFPLYVGGSTYRSLKFMWRYWRTAYSLFTGAMFVIETSKVIYGEIPTIHSILTVDELIFYVSAVVKFILMFKLTTEWPGFVKEWHLVELQLSKYQFCGNLRNKINTITFSIMTMATVEHFLINFYNLNKCIGETSTILDGMELYFTTNYRFGFIFFPYSLGRGLMLEMINLQMAFIWNYADIFIMIIGSAINFKLKQITNKIKILIKLKTPDENSWKTVRKHYLLIVSLCNITNERLSYLILISFSVNLYFILKQMFMSLMQLESTWEKMYFYISFALLITRLCCVVIFGSGVHDEWRDIGFYVHSVRSSAYNVEVEHFIDNIITHKLVLSGMNFFSIKRDLILKIAGTIVTYELVVIQFNMDMLNT